MVRTLLVWCVLAGTGPAGGAGPWQELEPGLELAEFPAPIPARRGDSRIRILRIDPLRFDLRLLTSTMTGASRTPRNWAREYGLVAVINAAMYQEDRRTSVSFMRTGDHVNNPRLSPDRAVLAFQPRRPGLPPVQIIDRDCDDLDSLRHEYETLVQSIRMVSCRGENVWAPGHRAWSTAAVGIDGSGRPLFIHVASPYPVHDLVDMLLGLPLDLRRCMYTEGGFEAQLYIAAGDEERAFSGMLKTAFPPKPGGAWPIPNVIGVVRRPR